MLPSTLPPPDRRSHPIPGLAPGIRALLPLCAVLLVGCDRSGGIDAAHGATPTVVPDAEEVYRIGSQAGGRWDSFSRIVAASFDGDGNLYLLDAENRSVTVVDRNGRFVRAVGRPGDGPGEFRNPVALAVLPEGEVVVSDTGHRGLLLFGADGGYVRSLPFGDGVPAPSILHPHGDDAVVFAATGIMMGPGMGGPGAQGPTSAPVRVTTLDGETSHLHDAWIPPRPTPQTSGSPGAMRMVRPIRAFTPQLHVTVLPDGAVVVVDSTTYRLQVVRSGPGVDETLERPIRPTPITDRERERERARRLAELESGGGPTGPVATMGPGGAGGGPTPSQMRGIMEEQLRDNLVFWPEIQVIQWLAADREGRIWLERFRDVGEPGPIEVLGADGTLRAVVPAGAIERPVAFGPGGLAAWIERDELDVPFVRVARLHGVP